SGHAQRAMPAQLNEAVGVEREPGRSGEHEGLRRHVQWLGAAEHRDHLGPEGDRALAVLRLRRIVLPAAPRDAYGERPARRSTAPQRNPTTSPVRSPVWKRV